MHTLIWISRNMWVRTGHLHRLLVWLRSARHHTGRSGGEALLCMGMMTLLLLFPLLVALLFRWVHRERDWISWTGQRVEPVVQQCIGSCVSLLGVKDQQFVC